MVKKKGLTDISKEVFIIRLSDGSLSIFSVRDDDKVRNVRLTKKESAKLRKLM